MMAGVARREVEQQEHEHADQPHDYHGRGERRRI
jgi:hypothetical protein